MSKFLRYMGEFLSHANTVWRVEILQEANSAFATVGELTFEAEEALVIEWKHADKEEVICGSTATIQIESPSDRAYEDLYSIEVGQIRMDVFKDGNLYWSGALDPEFYEEPYERARHYVVSLTFSDFGILGRLKYNLSGLQTLQAILLNALTRSTINYGQLDADTYCSTYFEGSNTKANPAALAVRSENFFDEDGEASTLEDVVIGILQPLALKMIQRNGKVYVFDLNGLFHNAPRKAIVWDGDSQTMGVDKVANNVKIGFSPYSSAKLLEGELEYNDTYDAELTNLTSSTSGCEQGLEYYSYYPNFSDENRQGTSWDYNLINFTIFLSNKGKGLAYLSPSARYCHIQPMVSGPSEETAIAWSFYTGGHGSLDTGWPVRKLNAVGKGSNSVLMKTNRVFIPKLSAADKKKYYLKLSLEMLLDARYNPFNEARGNEEGNYNNFKVWTGWAFVPVGITLYDSQGNAISHFVNRPKTISGTQGNMFWSTLDYTSIYGQVPAISWQPGAASFGDCWLEYYDPDDLSESAGILGWHKNRQNIGRPDRDNRKGGATGGTVDYTKGYFPSNDFGHFYMYESFKKQPDGEFIPYPSDGGYLEIVVYEGVRCFDYGESGTFEQTQTWDNKGLYNKIRWLLYKAPVLEVVRKNLIFDDAELEDVEYSGYINKAAKEEISIDSICGTANKVCPTAKGIYHRASDSLQIQQLKRENVTDHPEKLLIGTMYSQYASRHTTLQGEAVIDTGPLCAYTERNQSGKVFVMSEESQDVIRDVTEALYTEFNKDEYDAIEEVNNN